MSRFLLHLRVCSVLAAAFWVGGATFAAADPAVRLEIDDAAPFHVHAPGSAFSLTVTLSAPGESAFHYYWSDGAGHRLSDEATLHAGGAAYTVRAPLAVPGYYGLVVTPPAALALPGRNAGEAREYGFVIAAMPAAAAAAAASPFGLVHADLADPYMPVWVKTITWHTTTAPFWHELIMERTRKDKIELPIINAGLWETDDALPISEHELLQLKDEAKAYFAADPAGGYWEGGLEENLGKAYVKPYYWQNLAKKFAALHAAAAEAKRPITLLYQVAGTDTQATERFFASPAAKEVDILSVHPYQWPDFPSPDTWLEKYLDTVEAQARAHHVNLPLWFTEVGAPHWGNVAGGFFGYPEKSERTGGLSREASAAYLIKTHVIALARHVGKIFWYNYRDATSARDQAEAHFGLRDFWGYPKPAYAAYVTLQQALAGRAFKEVRHVEGGATLYVFTGQTDRIGVLFAPPHQRVTLAASSLPEGFGAASVIDMLGRPVPYETTLEVSDAPLFLRVAPAR